MNQQLKEITNRQNISQPLINVDDIYLGLLIISKAIRHPPMYIKHTHHTHDVYITF